MLLEETGEVICHWGKFLGAILVTSQRSAFPVFIDVWNGKLGIFFSSFEKSILIYHCRLSADSVLHARQCMSGQPLHRKCWLCSEQCVWRPAICKQLIRSTAVLILLCLQGRRELFWTGTWHVFDTCGTEKATVCSHNLHVFSQIKLILHLAQGSI